VRLTMQTTRIAFAAVLLLLLVLVLTVPWYPTVQTTPEDQFFTYTHTEIVNRKSVFSFGVQDSKIYTFPQTSVPAGTQVNLGNVPALGMPSLVSIYINTDCHYSCQLSIYPTFVRGPSLTIAVDPQGMEAAFIPGTVAGDYSVRFSNFDRVSHSIFDLEIAVTIALPPSWPRTFQVTFTAGAVNYTVVNVPLYTLLPNFAFGRTQAPALVLSLLTLGIVLAIGSIVLLVSKRARQPKMIHDLEGLWKTANNPNG
jgi:hypothetical protein